MIVVSDTSPLRALQALDLVTVLFRLYQKVVVPTAVHRELSVSVPRLGRFPVDQYAFISVAAPSPSPQLDALRMKLDEGEAEAIALALELRADLLLVDELDGRDSARGLGLRTRGVLGVLVQAKYAGLCGAVWPLIQRLQTEFDFHVSHAIIDEVLRQAGEGRA